MPTNNPPYIDFPGNIVMTQPVEEQYTQIYGFLVQGDQSSLQKMVDQRLNFMSDRPGTKYLVASDKVLLAFTTSVVGHSLTTDAYMGYSSEVALLTFVLLAKCVPDGDDWSAQELVFFAPFTFVDNPLSMAVGRETYGFPKSIGYFDVPTDYRFVYNLSMNAVGYKEFNQNARAYLQNIIMVNRTVGDDTTTAIEIGKAQDMWAGIKKQMLPQNPTFKLGFKFFVNELADLFKLEVPLVFLRQLRDIENAQFASYQALIYALGKVNAFRGGSLYSSPFTVQLNDVATYPIASELGIANLSNSLFSFRVELDLEFGNGIEEYRSV